MASFDCSKPEHQLEEIPETSLTRAPHLWQDLPKDLTAMEIKTRLEDRDSPGREQVKELLRWSNACGTYLARLTDGGSRFVSEGAYDSHGKRKRYRITKP